MTEETMGKEMVNHPSHYNQGSIETITVIHDWQLGFSSGNALKYISRAAHKGKKEEDLKKAIWYLEDAGVCEIHRWQPIGRPTFFIDQILADWSWLSKRERNAVRFILEARATIGDEARWNTLNKAIGHLKMAIKGLK